MKNSINERIKQAKNGSSTATEELLQEYRPMIDSALSAFLPSLTGYGYTDEDLRQDAALAFVRAVQTYDADKGVTFGAYAKKCVRNCMISVYRKQKRRVRISERVKDVADEPHTQLSVPDDFDDRLTDFEHEVYTLYMDAYKPREIANILKRDAKSVYNALCRIRQKAKNS